MEKKSVNRRNFLKYSAALGAGAFVTTDLSAQPGRAAASDGFKIPVRTLGKRTGVQLPILGMGVDRPDSGNLVRAAYNAGVVHFDTAHSYQNGKNEEALGVFFADKPRESCFISTKIWITYPLKDDFEEVAARHLAISLKRLQMNYVDAFYIHSVGEPGVLGDDRVKAFMTKVKAEGKTRFLGFSSHDNKPELIDAAIDAGIYDIILLSYNFKLKNLQQTNEAIERGARAGIGFIAMKTMAGGVEDADGKRQVNGQACLKWAWQNEYITTIIPGLTRFDQLEDCLAAVKDLSLTQSEQEYLAGLSEKELLYCQNCEVCKSQCPKRLPIPDMMRAYMYAYGYKQAGKSKETLLAVGVTQDACSGCDVCRVQCPSGFNVSQKIASLLPVLQVPNEFLA